MAADGTDCARLPLCLRRGGLLPDEQRLTPSAATTTITTVDHLDHLDTSTTSTGSTTPAAVPAGLAVLSTRRYGRTARSPRRRSQAPSRAPSASRKQRDGFFRSPRHSHLPYGLALKKALPALKASGSEERGARLRQGSCTRHIWSGDGPGLTPTQIGGHRFCFFDSKGNAAIAWTHERRGTKSHLDMIAVARLARAATSPSCSTGGASGSSNSASAAACRPAWAPDLISTRAADVPDGLSVARYRGGLLESDG